MNKDTEDLSVLSEPRVYFEDGGVMELSDISNIEDKMEAFRLVKHWLQWKADSQKKTDPVPVNLYQVMSERLTEENCREVALAIKVGNDYCFEQHKAMHQAVYRSSAGRRKGAHQPRDHFKQSYKIFETVRNRMGGESEKTVVDVVMPEIRSAELDPGQRVPGRRIVNEWFRNYTAKKIAELKTS